MKKKKGKRDCVQLSLTFIRLTTELNGVILKELCLKWVFIGDGSIWSWRVDTSQTYL
jgi:hypothetical protein